MVYMTIYWTSEDCHGQAILTLHLSVGQVILFPYFDHWVSRHIELTDKEKFAKNLMRSETYDPKEQLLCFDRLQRPLHSSALIIPHSFQVE